MKGTVRRFMVFDVESVGLHGEGFAVGYSVIDFEGVRLESGLSVCPEWRASGSKEGREWVMKNVPPMSTNCFDPKGVRSEFWAAWEKWKKEGAIMVADCGWPVEARFLNQCVEDSFSAREWGGPYPLYDLGPMLWSLGKDPLESRTRLPEELPEHNPLADAVQSARIFCEEILHRNLERC